MKNRISTINKIIMIMTLVLSCLFPSTSIVMADETEGIEEWIESEEIILDKVI